MDDRTHMRAALSLARRGLGATWPNPSVGCVIVSDGVVVGRGRTGDGGRPHAEVEALRMAGARARGATAYVTLEPCSHHGQTAPCAGALAAAGIARCVVAAGDPDLRVHGAGFERLRAAGIEVAIGLEAAAASALVAGFVRRVTAGRPLVTLKLASTLDGRIATAGGESRWITGPAARRTAHAMRAEHDAVMVGIGTALADDPDLRCRIDGFTSRAGVRVVADGGLGLPLGAGLVTDAAEAPCWLLHRADAAPARRAALEAAGVRCLAVPAGAEGLGIDPAEALAALGSAGLTSVLVEGGARLASSLLRAGLVDRIAWFHAPALLGADAVAAVQALGVATLAQMPHFARRATQELGADVLSEFERAT